MPHILTTALLPPNTLDACPLCGGELQATLTEHLSHVYINRSGEVVASLSAQLATEATIYCENDHTWAQMQGALSR